MIIFASDEADFSFYFFLVYVVTDNFSSNHLTCQMSIILYSHMWKDQMTFSKQLPKIHSPKIKFAFLKSILPFSVFHGWRPPLLQANGPHTVCSAFYLLIFLVCLNCFFFFSILWIKRNCPSEKHQHMRTIVFQESAWAIWSWDYTYLSPQFLS